MNGGKNTIKTVELSSKNMVPVLLIAVYIYINIFTFLFNNLSIFLKGK